MVPLPSMGDFVEPSPRVTEACLSDVGVKEINRFLELHMCSVAPLSTMKQNSSNLDLLGVLEEEGVE